MKNIISFAYPKSNGFAPAIFDRDIGITANDVRKFLSDPKNKTEVIRTDTVTDCMRRLGEVGGQFKK
jgi:hypothetical protein